MLKKVAIALALVVVALSFSSAFASGGKVPPTGKIWFGGSFVKSGTNLLIKDKKTTFHVKDKMAWVAHFKEPAATHKISLTLWTKKHGKTVEIYKPIPVTVHNLKSTEFANNIKAKSLVSLGATKAGKYAMVYSRGKTTLAAGAFYLVK